MTIDLTKKYNIDIINNIINDPSYIKNLKSPDEYFQKLAVNRDSTSLKYIDNPTIDIQRLAITKEPFNIQYIVEPSEELQLFAINIIPDSLKHMFRPSEKVQKKAVSKKPNLIKYIDNPSYEVQLEAIKKEGKAYRYIINPDKRIEEYLIDKGIIYFFKNFKHIDDDMIYKVLKQDGNYIRYVKDPSYKMKLTAVKQTYQALDYIEHDNMIYSLQLIAFDEHIYCPFTIVEHKDSESFQRLAIDRDYNNLQHIEAAGIDIEMYAIDKSIFAIKYVKTITAQSYAIDRHHDCLDTVLKLLQDPSEELVCEIVRKDPYVVKYFTGFNERTLTAFIVGMKNRCRIYNVDFSRRLHCFNDIKKYINAYDSSMLPVYESLLVKHKVKQFCGVKGMISENLDKIFKKKDKTLS